MLKTFALKTALALVAVVCGFWVVGSRNLLYWTHLMSEWINGDNGPDVFLVLYETLKLIVRTAIGGYGFYELLKKLMGVGLK